MTIIIDNAVFHVELQGEYSKREFNSVKKHLYNLLDYIEQSNKKSYIVADIYTFEERRYADITINTYICKEEITFTITLHIHNNLPMEIRSITHNFTSFETEFLKTMSAFRLEISDKENWSPVISLGTMYIYFVNFFIEYIEHRDICLNLI